MANNKKSSKKKGKSGISSSPGAAPRNTDGTNMEVELVTPVSVDAKEMSNLAARAKERFPQGTKNSQSNFCWRVYIHRAHMWFNIKGACQKKRINPMQRCWWVSFILVEQNITYLMTVEDCTATCKDPRRHPFTADMFWAALCNVLTKSKTPVQNLPNKLLFWPNPSFRIDSIAELIQQMAVDQPDIVLEQLDAAASVPDYLEGGCEMNAFKYPTDETKLIVQEGGIVDKIEHVMYKARALNRGNPFWLKKCLTEHYPSMSIRDLRFLFDVAKQFHDERPWEVLTNFHFLDVTFGEKTWWIVVAGNGSWDARGIHFYHSCNDMIETGRSRNTEKVAPSNFESYTLMYFARLSTSFRLLDHIEELDLPISRKDGADGEYSYPLWFSNHKFPWQTTEEDLMAIGDSVPPQEWLESFSIATLAVLEYMRKGYCKSTPSGGTCTIQGAQPVVVNVPPKTSNGPVLKVLCKVGCQAAENPEEYKYAGVHTEEHMATMSIGDTRVCNFCQKPEKLMRKETGERLLTCSRCKSIHYCSKKCQAADWHRHKKAECRPVQKK